MTRKDYILIANSIHQAMEDAKRHDSSSHVQAAKASINMLAEHIAIDLKRDNPAFNRDRFLNACGCVTL